MGCRIDWNSLMHILACALIEAGSWLGEGFGGPLIRLLYLLMGVKAKCVVGRVGLGCSIHWFVYETGLETELTS